MCSLSYSTYKPEVPLVKDLSTRSEQQLMEESGGVYCHLCNKHHGVHSQTMSPAGKDINNFTNPLFNNNGNTIVYYVEPFIHKYVCI